MGAERVDFVAVPTRDKERAVKFYGETLGLKRNPLTPDSWDEFEVGNVTLAVVAPESIGVEFAPLPFGAIAIRVPDVAEARAKLEEAGVEFAGETFDSGVCHGAMFKDPDGNGLMLHRRYAPYSDGSTP
ncbi:MAG: VOC family protein [Actinobacteria bacterium]|nr:VOC family protein [Actinomycetota bacterium]